MFFTNSNVNFNSFYREPEPAISPTSFGETWDASRKEAEARGQLLSSYNNLTQVYDEHNKKVKELTGVDLINPTTIYAPGDGRDEERRRYYADFARYKEDGGGLNQLDYLRQWRERDYRQKLEELAAKHPDKRGDLLPERSFSEAGYAKRGEAEKRVEEGWQKSNKGLLDWAAWIGGQAHAGFTDPVNVLTMPFGFGGVGTGIKGLAMGVVKNGGFNAAIEAAQQPFIQMNNAQAGDASGLAEGAAAVGGAFALGGALDLGVRGTARALRHSFGYEPVLRDGIVVGYKKKGEPAPMAEGAPVLKPEEVHTAAVKDKSYISAETITKAEDQLDAKAIREIAEKSGMADHPVVRQQLDAMDANEALLRRPTDAISESEHADGVTQALRHAVDPETEPVPVVRVDASPAKLRDLDGEIRTLAAEVRVLQQRVADGDVTVTPADVDAVALKLNEAQALHDDMRGQVYGDDLITAVDEGRIPPDVAEVVATHVADKEIQGKVAADVMARRPVNADDARHMVAEITNSPDYRAPDPVDAEPVRALDDPYGPDAVKQVQQLEAQMAEELGRKTAPQPTPEDMAAKVKEVIDHGAKVRAAIEEIAGVVPDGVSVRVFSSVADLPDGVRARTEAANAAMFAEALKRFQGAGSDVDRATARAMLDDAVALRGIEGIAQDNTIWIASFAMNPKGRVAHETVHALRTAGQIAPAEIKALADYARETGTFGESRAKLYAKEFEGRGFTPERIAELLDEEAAAHAIEARVNAGETPAPVKSIMDRLTDFFERVRNALRRQGFMTAEERAAFDGKPVNDAVQAFITGEMAKREGVKAWMRQEDLTAYAMREGDDHVANSWDDMAARDYSLERARWQEVTRPVYGGEGDVTRRASDAIMKKAASAERDLIRQGLSPREIAAAMNKLHGTSLTAEDIAARNVWWNVDNKLPPAFDKAPEARTSWTPELTALVESMVQDGALFGDIAKEVSRVVGRDVDPATIYNRVVRTASERKTVGKPIEPSSAWPADALNILRSDEIKDLSYSKISSLLEDRTGNIYSRNAVASKLAAIRREKGDPLFAIRDERSADARFELERPQAVRGDLGTGSGRLAGQQPAQGAAIAGDPGSAGRVGNDGGPREFRIPGYNGRVVELENSAGQRTRDYFVYPLNAEVTTKLSGASALKYMQQVHNWTARMTLTEMAPGAWEVKGVKVRANQRRSGVGSYVYDMIERDLEAPIRPSGMLTDDGHGFWSNRDPEAVKNHRQVGDMWLSPKQLMNMKVLISQIAETETDPAQIMRLMRQNQQINDGIKSLPKEVFEPKAINAMFAFAGERAKTADLEALNRAKEMTVAGLDRAKIWHDTGWFQGVDGKWRFEIDDSALSVGSLKVGEQYKVGEGVTHPNLYAAYPSIADMMLYPQRGNGGFYSDGDVALGMGRERRGTAGHELMHATQEIEGFAAGGTVKVPPPNAIALRVHGDLFDAARADPKNRAIPDVALWDALAPQANTLASLDTYNRLAGEVEARAVEKRMDLTPEQRRARPPWLDYDVPESQQIVRGASEPLFAMVDRNVGQEMRRDLDQLGYFSGALEAAKRLKQAKGTPEQMLAMLQKEGAKKAEIEATGLAKAFEGKASVTRDEIVKYLEDNRVGLNEVRYGTPQDPYWRIKNEENRRALLPGGATEIVKWQSRSLDPSNPTYRETVLHLPDQAKASELDAAAKKLFRKTWAELDPTQQGVVRQMERSTDPTYRADTSNFRSGHFPEPNIVGHMMTSMTKHEGKPVYTIDQIQSDWGQKLRDGGVRDEAKIADLEQRSKAAEKQWIEFRDDATDFARNAGYEPNDFASTKAALMTAAKKSNVDEVVQGAENRLAIWDEVLTDNRLLKAELDTAKSAVSGHPLVNTTDQWTNTTLRRAIRQAAEADADYIAIPHGDTVLSYNPGDAHGMQSFYGTRTADGIVPKNLRKLLQRIDKDSPSPTKVTELETSSGKRGFRDDTGYDFDPDQTGFTLFPLTEKVKETVRSQGQPLFAMRSEVEAEARPLMRAAAERGVTLPDGSTVHGVPLFAIRAFHGSPHDFERFDISKIGTGEGAQAYGHGLYFAENEGVARSYRDALAERRLGKPTGRMYEVNIKADPERMIHFDAPLSQQSTFVKNALHSDQVLASLKNQFEVIEGPGVFGYKGPSGSVMGYGSRAEAMAAMENDKGTFGPSHFADDTAVQRILKDRDPVAMSDALRQQGVHGVIYLDQGSRGVGEGTHNYVVFDDSLIEIVAKDGKPVGGEPQFAMRDDRPDLTPERITQAIQPYIDAYPNLARILQDGITDKADLSPILSRLMEDVPALTEARAALAQLAGPDVAEQIELAVLRSLVTGESPLDGVDVSGIARQVMDLMQPQQRPDAEPLFAMRDAEGKLKLDAQERAKQLQDELAAIEAQFATAGGDERLKLQARRAALLGAQAYERLIDDTGKFTDASGRNDRAKGLMAVIESFGNREKVPFVDLVNLKSTIQNDAVRMLDNALWAWRKGAVTGDLRRKINGSVKANMENVVRVLAGEKVADEAAQQFAKTWQNVSEYLRQRFNAAGGDIAKLEGWIMPQFHDAEALLKGGRDAWVKFIAPLLDRKRITDLDGNPLSDAKLASMLKDIWTNITTDGAFTREISDAPGKGALYKRHMEHRVLHFKDADSWLAYSKKYGGNDLYAAMVHHINMMSRDIALLERMGPNPELTMRRMRQVIEKEAAMAGPALSLFDEFKAKIEDLKAELKALPSEVDQITKAIGDVHTELDRMRDTAGTSKRARRRVEGKLNELRAKLGPLHDRLDKVLNSNEMTPEQRLKVDEINAAASEMAIMEEWRPSSANPVGRANRIVTRAEEMFKLFNGATNVPVDNRLAAGMVGIRNIISSSALIYAPFSAVTDQSTQLAARSFIGMPATNQLWSFVKGFTQGDRQAALAVGLGLDQVQAAFADQARMVGWYNTRHFTGYIADRTHAFSFLSPMTQAAKTAFGLDFMRWMAGLRDTKFDALDDVTQRMLARHGFAAADWDKIRAATPERIAGSDMLTRTAIEQAAGRDIAERYMVMLFRERGQAVLEGNLQGRSAWISEAKPGTASGEFLRSAAVLKSFSTTYMMLILGRLYNEIQAGRGLSASTLAYGASIFVAGTMLGAVAKQLKNIGQGRDPEDMTKPKFWAQSFMQSGGAGIFGDFIWSATNRNGSGLSSALAGPVPERLGTVLNMVFGNAVQYAQDEKTNAGREFVTLMRQNTPGMLTPWYIRLGYERLILDELQRRLDPEAHKSWTSKVRSQKKRQGNDFYWPPGGSYRPPALGAAFGRQ